MEWYERDIWVKEENVIPGEEWLDLKLSASGKGYLVRVNRECNQGGYTVGDPTVVNLTRVKSATMG